MAGSTKCAGGFTMPSVASESVMLWPSVNAETMARSRGTAPAEQQQADDEEDVVGADGDVMDA